MQTRIGSQFDRRQRLAAFLVGVTVAAADLANWKFGWFGFGDGRGAIAVPGVALFAGLSGGNARNVGLRCRPIQGWWYWVRAGIVIGAVVGVLVVAGWTAWILSGRELPAYAIVRPPSNLWSRFFFMCVAAPVLEEAIYRFALCNGLAPFGAWKAIVTSGVAFGLLHVIYGTPSPENLFGGLFLAWAYLKSESMLLPVLLHSLGNLIALASPLGTWWLI